MARNRRIGRRAFSKLTAAAAASPFSFTFIPSRAWGKLEKPTFAAIGVGGKGATDLKGAKDAGFELAALVDIVDTRKLNSTKLPRNQGRMQAEYPDLPFFSDYREMLAKMGDKVDAVTVSTPDHHHFHASYLSMRLGKHVYCQKPLTHGIWESRTLTQIAKQNGVKTQMGNQAHANDHMRRCVELVRAGIVGPVTEVHGWTNRPIWPQGFATLPPGEPIPAWMNWDQWIGPAPVCEYSSKLAPFGWRGAWDFGSGALGDMACHILDFGWWAVMPGAARSVIAEQTGGTRVSPPISSQITWEFGPTKYTSQKGCKFIWYDGYPNARFDSDSWALVKESDEFRHPDAKLMNGEAFRDYDIVVVGENGKLFFNRSRNNWKLLANPSVDGMKWPEPNIPRASGQDNYREWYDSVTGKIDRSQSDFSVAGPFTEMILLGTLAQRLPGQMLEWDDAKMEVVGHPETQPWIRRQYRAGWEVPS